MRRLLLALAVSAAACADDDAPRQIAVAGFEFRECKTSADSGSLATGRNTEAYAGLECVAWRVTAQSTAIDLINRRAGCGFDGNERDESLWQPTLEQSASSQLTVRVAWDFSDPSACGDCLHDFSIRAQAAELSGTQLRLNVATRSCTSSDCGWSEDTLNAQSTAGIRCRYVDWDGGFMHQSYAGKLGGPARDGACDEPLRPTEIEGATRCLKACSSDADCDEEVSTCVEGTCRLTDPW